MDKNKIIILALVAIIVVLAIALFASMSADNKIDTKLTINCNSTLYKGDSISVKLTDLNGTPIVNQSINITIIDSDNASSYHSVVTNDEGVGEFKLDEEVGNYTINCIYNGNDIYVGNSTTKKITIKEEVVEQEISTSSSANAQSKTYASGLTDDEIEGYIQRDLNERAKNGVEGSYDYEEARQFYENVPPTGMV